LALVCAGQQTKTLIGSDAIGSNARGPGSEEQRGGRVSRVEIKSDEHCMIMLCEPGKSQEGDDGMDLPAQVRKTDYGGSQTRGIDLIRESHLTG